MKAINRVAQLLFVLIIFFQNSTMLTAGNCANENWDEIQDWQPSLSIESSWRYNVKYFANDEMVVIGSRDGFQAFNTNDFSTEYVIHSVSLPNFREDENTIYSLSTMNTDSQNLLFIATSDTITSANFTGQLTMWDAISGVQLSIIDTEASITNLSLNSINELLIYTRNLTEIRIVDVNSKNIVASFETRGRFGGLPTFSPEGNLIAYLSDDVIIWDIEEQQELYRFTPSSADVSEIFFSPDGNKFFISYDSDVIFDVWSIETGEKIDTVSRDGKWLSAYNVHPNSDAIAYSLSGEGRVNILSLTNKVISMNLEVGDSSIVSIDFDESGNLLATSDWDGVLTIWDVISGHKLFSYDFGEQVYVNFSPNNDFLTVKSANHISIFACNYR